MVRTTTRLSTLALLIAATQLAVADSQSRNQKIDRALRESLSAGAPTQSVIITVKPGHRDALRQVLQRHGDAIRAEHPLIDAVAAELHSDDVEALANQPWIESVASDALVYAKASTKKENLAFEQIQTGEFAGIDSS